MDDLKKNNEESREYYRINDIIELSYYMLSSDETLSKDDHDNIMAKFLTRPQRQQIALMQEVNEISIEMAKCFSRATGNNTDLAKYLEFMQRKIDLIARNLCSDSTGELCDVNLSVGGCSFDCAQELPAESLLKVRLVFRPSSQIVILDAVVVRCEKDEECPPKKPFRVSVEFIGLDDKQEFVLNRHIASKQLQDIRSRKK